MTRTAGGDGDDGTVDRITAEHGLRCVRAQRGLPAAEARPSNEEASRPHSRPAIEGFLGFLPSGQEALNRWAAGVRHARGALRPRVRDLRGISDRRPRRQHGPRVRMRAAPTMHGDGASSSSGSSEARRSTNALPPMITTAVRTRTDGDRRGLGELDVAMASTTSTIQEPALLISPRLLDLHGRARLGKRFATALFDKTDASSVLVLAGQWLRRRGCRRSRPET